MCGVPGSGEQPVRPLGRPVRVVLGLSLSLLSVCACKIDLSTLYGLVLSLGRYSDARTTASRVRDNAHVQQKTSSTPPNRARHAARSTARDAPSMPSVGCKQQRLARLAWCELRRARAARLLRASARGGPRASSLRDAEALPAAQRSASRLRRGRASRARSQKRFSAQRGPRELVEHGRRHGVEKFPPRKLATWLVYLFVNFAAVPRRSPASRLGDVAGGR